MDPKSITVCAICGAASSIKQGRQHLCDRHYRLRQMRVGAKRNGKAVPSLKELEQMPGADLVCPDCAVRMNWRGADGTSTVASLQHYRDGSMAIVCRSCNTRHAFMDGDAYCAMPKDHKQCPCCSQIKALTEFTLDASRSGPAKRKSKCKQCSKKQATQWKEDNRERYNEYQREYRLRKKSEQLASG